MGKLISMLLFSPGKPYERRDQIGRQSALMREEKCKATSRAEFEIHLEEMSCSDKKKVENIWGEENKRREERKDTQ